jgi:hypothetical protein
MPPRSGPRDYGPPTTCTVEEQANAIRKFMESIRALKDFAPDSYGDDFTDAQIKACNEFDAQVSRLESAAKLLMHTLAKK